MRVLLLTVLLLAGGSQANFLTDIGDAFKTTFNSLVDTTKQVGQGLLDELKVTGAQLASQGLQSLMLNIVDAVSATDPPATASAAKRQLETSIHLTDPDGTLYAHADELKGYMQTALHAAERLNNPDYLQTIQDFMNQLDQLVANHDAATTTAFRRRDLHLNQAQDLEALVAKHANELKQYLQTSLSALSGLAERLQNPETFFTNFQTFIQDIDQVIADHDASADAVVQKLMQEVTSMVPTGNKRALVDSLSAVGQGLSQMFQPHVDVIKSLVSSVGQVLKNAASQVFSSLMSSVTGLGAQLSSSQHIDAMKSESAAVAQNGQDAVSALKDAVGDIMQQTLNNIKPHLTNIASHVLSALVGK